MDRESILATLRAHQPELVAAGLLHLRLFGSVARGDSTPDSDVDLLFDYDESDSWNAVGAFSCEDQVSKIIGTKVHLSAATMLRERVRETALKEAIHVY